jgi:hypothetical protein
MAELCTAFRAAGQPIVHVARLYLADGSNAESSRRALVRGGLQAALGCVLQTPLDDHLRQLGVTTLMFAGCNFPNCHRTSMYEASERDYGVVLAEDAVSGLYEQGRQELVGIGVECLPTRAIIERVVSAR